MEGPSNGGLLYHEVQESKLCAVHCVNTVLQGPFFSEVDLAALASDLDQTERQVMLQGSSSLSEHFLAEDSHNVSMGGDFSIQVLEKALAVWDLQVIPFNSPVVEPSKHDPELENAFICHLHDHWFCIRKVNGEWYNFNSLYAAPEHLSKFYLAAYLDSLKGCGWSIFLVRGNFPKECPISSSEDSNAFGQWLTPEDAERITKSCNEKQVPPPRENLSRPDYSRQFIYEADAVAAQEELDLNAAIAASLMDSSAFTTVTGNFQDNDNSAGSPAVGSQSGVTESSKEMGDLNAAVAASLMDSSAFSTGTDIIQDKGNSAGSAAVGSQSHVTQTSSNLMDPQTDSTATGESKEANLSDPAAVVHKTEMAMDDKDQ